MNATTAALHAQISERKCRRTVEALARQLDIDPATPCLSMTRRTWSDDHLISYARLIHPGDRYKLRSSLRGGAAPAPGRGR